MQKALKFRRVFAPEGEGGGAPPAGSGGEGGKPNEGAGEGGTPPEGGNVEELPKWARDAITKANKETAGFRTKLRELEPLAQKAKDLEEANKSETQKLADERDSHKGRADSAELTSLKLEVALAKAPGNATPSQVRTLAKRLVGATREELEADAVDLIAEFIGEPEEGSNKGGPARRPTERLRGGGAPASEPDETDPRKLAAQVARPGF